MWRWPRRGPNGDARKRREQEAKLRMAKRQTPLYREHAEVLAELPAEELATRVRDALTLRRG